MKLCSSHSHYQVLSPFWCKNKMRKRTLIAYFQLKKGERVSDIFS